MPSPIPNSFTSCRICSQDEAFHARTSQMSSFIKDHNFPCSVVKNARDRVSHISRNSFLTHPPRNNNENSIPLFLTYQPTNLLIQRIIFRHFRHLQ
eukprot:g13360.t1